MAETSLASLEDVVALLGRDLTSAETIKATALLAKASALFREEAGRLFAAGTSTVRLKANGGRVYLPEPIASIGSVVDDRGAPVAYVRRGQWLDTRLGSDAFVTVEYAHTADVPELARWTVAEVAVTVLTLAPSAASGITQSTTSAGPFSVSETYAAWAVGGKAALSPADTATARTFRPKVPTVWAQSAPAPPAPDFPTFAEVD